MNTAKVYVPSYFERFNCIGSACEENCCEADWKIFIDKNTYNLYRNIKDPDFQKKLPERIKRVKGETASDKNYAQICLDEQGRCKFLEDGMCSVQLKYGYKYLSVTCLLFPRKQLKFIGGNLESVLSMACPEAIREGLFPKEPMSFKYIELENTHGKSLAGLPPLSFDTGVNVLAVHAVTLRQSCIDIMQIRTMPISERILAVGMMLQKLRDASDIGDFDSAPAIAQKYVQFARDGQFGGLMSSFPENKELDATIKAKLFNTAISFDSSKNKRAFENFIPCVERYAERLEKNPSDVTHYELNEFIEKAAEKYWQDFFRERGHILENYFVNYIFGNVFPFAVRLGIQHHILLIAEAYALFRIILSACADFEGKITDENIIKTITCIFRHTNHSSMITNLTNNYIFSGLDTLPHIAFLLKD